MKEQPKQSAVTLNLKLPEVQELLEAGVHFGHATKRWNPKMSKYIYTKRGGVHIIDLSQTLRELEKTLKFLKLAARRGDIVIVGTKRQAYDLVQEMAIRSGSHYVTNRWAGGLMTNHAMVRRSLKKLKDLEKQLATGVENRTKQEIAWMENEHERLSRLYEGVKHLASKPAAVIVIDAKREKVAVQEANKAGIPVVALVDTNADPDLIDYIIPGNDDAVSSIEMMLNLMANAIIEGNEGKGLQALRKNYDAELEKIKSDAVYSAEKAKAEAERKQEERQALKKGRSVVRIAEARSEKKEEERKTVKVKKDKKIPTQLVDFSSLALSGRTTKALEAAKVSVNDLKKMNKDELAGIKGIGPKAVEEIQKAFSK